MKDKSFLEQAGVLESRELADETAMDERDIVDVKILFDRSHVLTYEDGSTEHVKW